MAERTRKRTAAEGLAARRRAMDRLNRRILRLVETRAVLAATIAREKTAAGRRVHDPAREGAMLAAVLDAASGSLEADLLAAVFKTMFRACRTQAQRSLRSGGKVRKGGGGR